MDEALAASVRWTSRWTFSRSACSSRSRRATSEGSNWTRKSPACTCAPSSAMRTILYCQVRGMGGGPMSMERAARTVPLPLTVKARSCGLSVIHSSAAAACTAAPAWGSRSSSPAVRPPSSQASQSLASRTVTGTALGGVPGRNTSVAPFRPNRTAARGAARTSEWTTGTRTRAVMPGFIRPGSASRNSTWRRNCLRRESRVAALAASASVPSRARNARSGRASRATSAGRPGRSSRASVSCT